jgi:hypothetical protein
VAPSHSRRRPSSVPEGAIGRLHETASLIVPLEFPDRANKFPVPCLKFTVPWRREFHKKTSLKQDFSGIGKPDRIPKIAEFPVFSLHNRESSFRESGSRQTPSSATESLIFGISFLLCLKKARLAEIRQSRSTGELLSLGSVAGRRRPPSRGAAGPFIMNWISQQPKNSSLSSRMSSNSQSVLADGDNVVVFRLT